ncbi:hypothetical protein RBA63_20745 [Brenneria goodwinii]
MSWTETLWIKLAMIAEGVALLTYKSFQREESSSMWLLSSQESGGRW